MSDKECCEDEKNDAFELGKVVMLEGLAKEYASLAGEKYGKRRYDEASATMGFADHLRDRAEKARSIYNVRHVQGT